MPKPWEVQDQPSAPKGGKPWEVDTSTFEESRPKQPAETQGTAVKGTLKAAEPVPLWKRAFMHPAVQGLTDPLAAVAQLAARTGMIPGQQADLMGTGPFSQAIDRAVRRREIEYRNVNPDRTYEEQMTRGLASTLPLMAIPGPKGAGAMRRIGQAALEGAAGAVLTPEVTKEEQADLFTSKGKKAAMGAAGGAAGGAVIGEAVVPGLTKLANSFKKDGPMAPAAKKFFEDMDLLGLPRDLATAGQAIGPKNAVQAYEKTMLGTGPLGSAGPMKKGYDALVQRARFIDERMKSQVKRAGFNGIEELEAAASKGDRNATRILTDVIPQAENDMAGVMKGSLEVEKARRGKIVGKLYDDVDKMADPAGPVDLTGTKAILKQIAGEESGFGGNEVLAKEAAGLLADLDATGGPSALYSQIRRKADKLGRKANEWTTGTASPEQRAAAYALRDVRDAMRAEMNGHVEAMGIPEASQALKTATEAYKDLMEPYKNKTIRNIMQTDATDEAVSGLVRKYGTTNIPAKVISAMGDKGRAAYRSAIISEKVAKATTGQGDSAVLSLNSLAKSIEDDAARLKTVFEPAETAELLAFANVLRHMESSQLAHVVQQNGSKLLPIALAGGGLGSIATLGAPATGAALGVGVLGRMFTSGPFKKYTLAASKLPPGHPMLEKILNEAVRAMPRTIGAVSGQNTEELQPEE